MLCEKRHTRLYSWSQFSSSQAASHLLTLSIISFLLIASSLAFTICASMLARRSEGSTRPEFRKQVRGLPDMHQNSFRTLIGQDHTRIYQCISLLSCGAHVWFHVCFLAYFFQFGPSFLNEFFHSAGFKFCQPLNFSFCLSNTIMNIQLAAFCTCNGS